MDRAKKQVEQVWMIPNYDMSDNGMCDGVIKQSCASRSPTWVVTLWERKRRNKLKEPKPAASSSPVSIQAGGYQSGYVSFQRDVEKVSISFWQETKAKNSHEMKHLEFCQCRF